ncbi:hypothetical protein D3C75_227760 [compost metagenome]
MVLIRGWISSGTSASEIGASSPRRWANREVSGVRIRRPWVTPNQTSAAIPRASMAIRGMTIIRISRARWRRSAMLSATVTASWSCGSFIAWVQTVDMRTCWPFNSPSYSAGCVPLQSCDGAYALKSALPAMVPRRLLSTLK